METKNNFDGLVCNITSVQDVLQTQAAHAINLALTTRNWLIGYYIVEYEQNGEDRAQYGEQLLKKLAKRIGRKGLGERRLYEFRQMYSTYPNLAMEVVAYLHNGSDTNILRSATAKLQIESVENEKLRLATAKLSESLSQNLFVSKYKLQLPSEDEIRDYLLANFSEDDYKQNDQP